MPQRGVGTVLTWYLAPPPSMPMDPPCQCPPPPLERSNMAPLANGPPLWKEGQVQNKLRYVALHATPFATLLP